MQTISIAELEAREKQLAEIIQEKQQLLESLRRTREYLKDGSEAPQASQAPHAPQVQKPAHPAATVEYGRNTRLVRLAVKSMAKNYTFKDIKLFLVGAGTPLPTNAISVVINRLKRIGEIKEFRKGKGRRAAIYRRID
jgi:hypothetical protein